MGQFSQPANLLFVGLTGLCLTAGMASAHPGFFHHDGGAHHAARLSQSMASPAGLARLWRTRGTMSAGEAAPQMQPQQTHPSADSEAPPTRSYAMSYGEEVRQALKMRDGRIDLIHAALADNSGVVAPTISAGFGARGLSMRLDW